MAVAVALVFASPAWGIVLYPDDTGPAVRPADPVVDRWFKTPTVSNACVVPIDPNYVITVRHSLGGVSDGSLVAIGTSTYTVAQEFDCGSADLRICRITNADGTPANLASYASFYTPTNEASSGLTFTMGGYGQGRGTTVYDTSGNAIGYNWDGSGNTTLRWGCNKIEAASTSSGDGFTSNVLVAYFNQASDPTYVDHESAIALYDSGGGWFVDVSPDGSGDWRLIGLTEGTQNPGESLFTPPDYFYGVRTSSYVSWIVTTLGRSMWNTNTNNSSWSTAGNWINGAPNGQGAYAMLSDTLNSNLNISLTSAVTLGTLWIEGAHQYTLKGSGSLTFDTTSGSALLNVSGASAQVINVPVALNVPLLVNQRAGGNLTFSKALSGAFQITKTGAGTMVLTASNGAFSGGFNVAQGLLRVTTAGGLGSGDVTLSGGSLGLRNGASTNPGNNVSATADATIAVDASSGSGLTFTLGQLAVAGDRTITVTSTSGCTVEFAGQSSLSGLSTGATFNTASANLKLTGGLTFSAGTLTKTGTGALTLAGAQSYGASGPAALAVAAGTVNLDSDAGPAPMPYGLSVTASGSAALAIHSTQHLAGLALSDSASATVGANGSRAVLVNALSVGPSAKIDLVDNNLVVNYSGSSPLKTIEGWIKAGGGTKSTGVDYDWNGTGGITSSAAAANKQDTSLGLRDNGFALEGRSALTQVDGVAVDPSSVIVKYTWMGDMDLDGKVTVNDYLEFLYYYAHPPSADTMTWMTGDFNYDGRINVDDYLMLLDGYAHQTSPLAADEQILSWAPLPEPGTLALLAIGLAAGLTRRRKA